MAPPLPRIFDFLDYRAYLRAFYEAKKAASSTFSFRVFARRAGSRAPNHLKRVMDGDRNLTPNASIGFAAACGLEGDEVTYFCDLVTMNQAKDHAAREAAYERLTMHRGYRRAHKLELAHAAYHGSWYVPAIREMVLRRDFQADPAWIAAHLKPPIAPGDAARALDTLLTLGLVSKNEHGKLAQSEPLATTGAETKGLHIARYHREMMQRAAEAIDVVPAAERDISSLTFCASRESLGRIKERVQRFRKELIAMLAEETSADQVLQLNMQLFPLSDASPRDGE